MAICAVAWLVAHVRMLGRDEREKPQTMIRQLVLPLFGENTLQFYNERYGSPAPWSRRFRGLYSRLAQPPCTAGTTQHAGRKLLTKNGYEAVCFALRTIFFLHPTTACHLLSYDVDLETGS